MPWCLTWDMAWREAAHLPVLFLGILGYGRAVSLGSPWRCWWLYSVLGHEMELLALPVAIPQDTYYLF